MPLLVLILRSGTVGNRPGHPHCLRPRLRGAGRAGFLYSSAPRIYPTLIRGVGVGAAVAFGRVGSIVGPKLGGTLKAAGHGSSQLLLDILPLVILGSVTALAFAWHTARGRMPAGSAS